jgi:RND family efflux transporter MFP subunit
MEEIVKKIIVIIIVLIALISVVIYAHFFSNTPSASGGRPPGRGARSVPVQVTQVSTGDITQTVAITGIVNALAEVEVYPKQAGELIELLVDKGDRVKMGQTLGRIESQPFGIKVKQAEAELAGVQADYDKHASVALVNAETAFKQATSNLDRLRASLKQAEVELELQIKQADVQVKKALADLSIAEARLEAVVSGARAQEIEQARVRKENAKRELDRLTALLTNEIISQDQVETAQLQYEIYNAQLSLLEEGARPEDVEVLKAQVESEKANVESAQENKMQIDIKRANLESVKAQVDNARAAFEEVAAAKEAATWKQELAQAEALRDRAHAALELAQRDLADTILTAPIDGVIAQRFLDKGDTTSLNRPFAVIVDMDVVKIAAKVPSREIPSIRIGYEAIIQPDAYPDEIFTGEVTYISPVIDRASQTGDIEIEVLNSDHKLKPGMFTRVTLRVSERNAVVIIPSDTLLKEAEAVFVYTVNDGTAHRKNVTTGVSDGLRTEILSGLASGESLVVAGQYSLRDRMSVTIAGGRSGTTDGQ